MNRHPLLLALPLAAALLAGCSEPPGGPAAEVAVPPGCENECAAGYRWAARSEVTDVVKCRGESGFADGCRLYVSWKTAH